MKHYIVQILLLLGLCACDREGDQYANEFYNVESNGATIPVLLKGNLKSNKIVIFMNGGPGLTGIDVGITNLAKWEENLEKDYAVAYFDQRGTGNTFSRLDTSTISLSQFSDDLYSVVRVIKYHYPEHRIYLMSHSFGGLSAADYLLNQEYRAEISGWICVSGYLVPNPVKSWEYRRTWLEYISNVEINKGNDVEKWQECLEWLEKTKIIETDKAKDKWREYVGNQEEGIVKDADAEIKTGRVMRIMFRSNYNIFPTYLSDNWLVVLKTIQRHYLQENYLEKIESIDVPTLLLWGEYDDLVPFQIGKDADSILDESEFILMKDAGHEPFLNDPVEYARIVKGWVAKH